ncbi:MAG: hypothetical protein U0231_16275 [Nitrospiraceae bacterium]
MIRMRPLALVGLLAFTGGTVLDGCASKSGTSGSNTASIPKPRTEERIAAPVVKEIEPPAAPAPPASFRRMAARNRNRPAEHPLSPTSCSTSISHVLLMML